MKTAEVEAPEVTMIDANVLVANRNSRYSLLKSRIEAMKDSILDREKNGLVGIMQPITIEPLTEEEIAENENCEYGVVFGHYRLAGQMAANEESGKNNLVPCIILDHNLTPVQRLKMQIAENGERENPTPIDKAYAIKEAFDLGMTRMEIRNLFPVVGGRKGAKSQPASNSYINMTLSFLSLSKKIQNLIHEGQIGVASAYWLTKQKPDDRDRAVETAITNRMKEIDQAEEEETKFLEAEKKAAEAEEKAKESEKALETAQASVEESIKAVKAKAAEAVKLYNVKMEAKDAEAKKAAEETHKEAEKAAKEAEKELAKKRAELQKEQEKLEKQKKAAEERATKLKAAKDAVKPAKESKSPLQVKKSAAVTAKESPNKQGIRLSQSACDKILKDLILPSPWPKVNQIAKAFSDCFHGQITDKELLNTLKTITGYKDGDSGSEPTTEAKPKGKAKK